MNSKKITGLENLYSTKYNIEVSNIKKNKIMPQEHTPIIKKLLIDTSAEGFTRLAKITEENHKYKLITMIEESDSEENIQSNIYLASVIKIDKTNNSIFLNYENSKICFLNLKELIKQNLTLEEINKIQIQDKMIVQMVRERKNHKHPKVTSNIMMYGLYANIILEVPFELIYQNNNIEDGNLYNFLSQQKNLKNIKIFLKQLPQNTNQKLLMDDLKYMIRTWKHIKTISKNKKENGLLHFEPHIQRMIRAILDNDIEQIIIDDENLLLRIKSLPFLFNQKQSKNIYYEQGNIFETYGLVEEVNKIDKLTVSKDGIRITFQKTEALITVDVDYSSKNKSIKNLWDINRAATQLIIEEIVKKNIGGSILVDFINMYTANEQHNIFIQNIKQKFHEYGVNCAVYSIKQLGLVFFCLPYNKYDIFNRVYEKCGSCQGGIKVKTSYQLNQVILSLNNYINNKTFNNTEDIFVENNKLMMKPLMYNNVAKHYPDIIQKLINNNIIPLIME
jgi:ribonuclease G